MQDLVKVTVGLYNEIKIEGHQFPQFWQEVKNGKYTTDCGEPHFTEINTEEKTISEINNTDIVKKIHFKKIEWIFKD